MSGWQKPLEEIKLSEGDYFRVIEERRRASESVLWQLLGISLAAQAFLLGAGLDPKAERGSQIAVGALGIFAVLATGLIVFYQALRASIFERWVSHTVCQPLRPDELATERPELNPRRFWTVGRAYDAFRAVCVVALLGFLVADGYVLGQGFALW